jgi:Transposase IS66 family
MLASAFNAVLHADETPVQMLKPGTGKTHRAYLWASSPGRVRAHEGRGLRLCR